ncbi:MAG: amylo-alpha-1,6-glucosidase [Deltaproteobacteria bacterium]|nr:amylo-alpha-1,6-glucosidase [Deltaproteobacteria bacterium]
MGQSHSLLGCRINDEVDDGRPLISLGRGRLAGDCHPLEWVVTNGRGGFALGAVAGPMTRRYHGLLTVATRPPVGRRRVVAAIDEVVHLSDARYELAAHRWADDTVAPTGDALLESFVLKDGAPRWRYAVADVLLDKRVWMEHGEDTTYCEYRVVRAEQPLRLSLSVLVGDRDFHSTMRAGDQVPRVTEHAEGVAVAVEGPDPLWISALGADIEVDPVWYRGFRLVAESGRGLDDLDDNVRVASLAKTLSEGETWTVTLTRGPRAAGGVGASERACKRVEGLLHAAGSPSDPRIAALVLAADQFIVTRSATTGDSGASVIAGYPWFGDWGRDTMIALPGLSLATGRPEVSAAVVRTFARYVDGGMIPNRFPDDDQSPEYNTFDATLWYVEAIAAHVESTGELSLAEALMPTLLAIFEAHMVGTRHGIGVDHSDGLLRGGEPGMQLTWMDAKVGDWVVTPRIGKPVEINALWINACRSLEALLVRLGQDARAVTAAAEHAEAGFSRFWNPARGFLFDVLDGPDGDDAALRPNQIFAVSLRHGALDSARQRAVVDVVQRELYTPLGLRSLGRTEPGYIGRYEGGPRERDGAYHQGTAWTWLLGPFARAHFRVHGDRARARSFLEPVLEQLHTHGVGSLPEIADGDPPHQARGCPAQAWSVAEVLAAWVGLLHQ